jgi:hypothetical protein
MGDCPTAVALDGNKAHNGARGILLGAKPPPKETDERQVMASKLKAQFAAQQKTGEKSTISYITTPAASDLIKEAELGLKNKFQKYQADTSKGNPNTRAVISIINRYIHLNPVRIKRLGGHEARAGAEQRLESGRRLGRSP